MYSTFIVSKHCCWAWLINTHCLCGPQRHQDLGNFHSHFFSYKSSIFGFELLKDISNEFERKKNVDREYFGEKQMNVSVTRKNDNKFRNIYRHHIPEAKEKKNTSLSKSLWPFLLDYFCRLHKMTNDSTLIVVSRCLLNATDIFVASTPHFGTWSLIVRASCVNVQNR